MTLYVLEVRGTGSRRERVRWYTRRHYGPKVSPKRRDGPETNVVVKWKSLKNRWKRVYVVFASEDEESGSKIFPSLS